MILCFDELVSLATKIEADWADLGKLRPAPPFRPMTHEFGATRIPSGRLASAAFLTTWKFCGDAGKI